MSEEAKVITLACASDAYNFRAGDPIALAMNADGSVRPLTAWERLTDRIKHRLLRATRWWRPRMVVAEVDTQLGTIGIKQESWSWRRWRWE